MKRKKIAVMTCVMLTGLAWSVTAQAAVADADVIQAYDAAVDMQDGLDGLNVTVKETVTVAGQSDKVEKTINLQTAGMQTEGKLQAAIDINTTDGDKKQYYDNGYFYSNQTGKNMKYAMKQDIMQDILNYYVYLDFNSEYLSVLEKEAGTNGGATYTFAATDSTIGEYADKLLEGAQEEHAISIVSLQGTVDTDANGNVTERKIEMVYSVKSGDQPQICILNSDAVFQNAGQSTAVSLPDLSSYKEKDSNEKVTTITPLDQTIYATTGINVRAQNNVTAAVIGGMSAGDAAEETGYTSDGWIQISYNNATGYISGNYVSTTKPVIVTAMSGTMYATIQVNVRSTYSTDGSVLGVMGSGDAIETKGYTDNNWIEVNYGGETGYVYADYLTWDAPEIYSAPANTTSSGYLEGTLVDASMNNLVVETSNGNEYTFSSGNAYMNTADGLIVGDWIGVTYVYDGSYTATEVDDYNNHQVQGNTMDNTMDDDYVEGYVDKEAYGTVIGYGMSSITVALDNGVTLSANKDNVTISGSMYEGAYVLVDYVGDYMYGIYSVE
ncbi:MAG: SH3 domain-containing protein [Lachnospiraceae bacterium]|nr:SH3 domain-containing protein [Lachnospiraceae bacterium]MDD3796050.1 SH3 domain-containing protein [Lachnospiraceae bacterium]